MLRNLILNVCVLVLCSQYSIAQEKQRPAIKKISVSLAERLYQAGPDSIDITLVCNTLTETQRPASYRVLHQYQNTKTVRILRKKIPAVVQDSMVLFADAVKVPKEELTTGSLDLAVNKLNVAHARFPALNGAGMLVSVKEQQFDTTDIDYKGRSFTTGAAAKTFTTHAAIMATTLAGAGNTSPFAIGAAPAAMLTSTSFESLLPESDAYYQQNNISIQNHSYGTVPENFYGAEAAAFDLNVENNPTLVHVFSAGNSGTTAGVAPYAGLQGWSNLTGNFKTAKNVIVVGAIDSFYQVAPASSKGPAFDGRIKPELVAFGEDGSSGAAALASGTIALVQQAYFNLKHTLPAASLVKAVILNSADDIYQKGVDYTSGFGSLNGYNAVKTIVENRLFEDSIKHGDLKKFALTIHSNTPQLKLTLAWTDVPAPVNASKALVNDLDLVLKNTETGKSWLPWVLHAAANADSIQRTATRKQDTLNNVEQVTVDSIPAGNYSIEITGRRVTTRVQAFDVAWQADTAGYFEWTFPTRNDPVIGGQTNVIRWQTAFTGTGILEYHTPNQDWQLLTDTIPLANNYFKWKAPDTLAATQLRMRFLNRLPVVTDTFVISKATALHVGFTCADSFLLSWNALPVQQYQLYNLGDRYLLPGITIADTFVILKTGSYPTPYVSVAPVVDGRAGLKSFTLNAAQGATCYFQSFYLQTQDQAHASFTALLGTTYNIDSLSFQKFENNQFITKQTVAAPATTAFVFNDSSLIHGSNRYRLLLSLHNGAALTSDEIRIFHFPDAPVYMYPNPVRQGQAVTILTNDAGDLRLHIFNAAGLLIKQLDRTSLGNALATAALPAGVYFVQVIKADGTRSTQKLVVY